MSQWGKRDQEKKRAASDHNEPATNMSDPSISPSEPISREALSPEEQHRADERSFWERQIEVAKRLNRLTGAAALVGLLGLAFVAKGVFDNEDATMRANRAWLASEDFGMHVLPNLPGIHITANTQNVGREPATKVEFSSHPESGFLNRLGFENKLMSINAVSLCGNDGTNKGEAVFPGPPLSYDRMVSGGGNAARASLNQVINGDAIFYWRDCVTYETFGKFHHTNFCYYAMNALGKVEVYHCWGGNDAD